MKTVAGIVSNAHDSSERGIIQLGLLILIATPLARVVFSVFAFAIQPDWLYVLVSLVALGVLTFSLIGAHVG
jgi:uncharacterized membrane protein